MARAKTQSALVTYRVKKGKETQFAQLLARHWSTLRKLRLVTEELPLYFRGEGDGKPFFVEIFTWKDDASVDKAHQSPEVQALWKPMEPLLEKPMEIVHATVVNFDHVPL